MGHDSFNNGFKGNKSLLKKRKTRNYDKVDKLTVIRNHNHNFGT